MITRLSPSSVKIAFFRSLFRGREDLYSRRFESRKTKKAGYAVVCGNEWVWGLCEKPKIRCAECRHHRFLPVSDSVIRWHLCGQDDGERPFVMGIHPLLLDETCFFLLLNFNQENWQKDAIAFLKTSQALNIPAALERSRSGKGAHVWLFFEEAVPSVLARKLGCHILTEMMEYHPDVGIEAYDKFIPSQDTLPKGSFGDLIALPLQGKARESGNSLFVNENWIPYEDQWIFLSKHPKIMRWELEEIVHRAERKGRILGNHLLPAEEDETAWNRAPSPPIIRTDGLPKWMTLTVDSEIHIPVEGLPPWLQNQLIRLAIFPNPEFYKVQGMRLSVYKKTHLITCAEKDLDQIRLPRGCLEAVYHLLSSLKIKVKLRNLLQKGIPLSASFLGELHPEQQCAAQALLKTHTGVLSATTAFGKTVIAAWLIAQRRVNTLILVHRRQLQEQWMERLKTFLDAPSIGRIGGGHKEPTGILDIALMQSLVREPDALFAHYGQVIIDECHHVPARHFNQILRRTNAPFITGLTATLARKDGLHPILTLRCGPVRYRVDAKAQAALRPFSHTVFVRPTGFSFDPLIAETKTWLFHTLYEALVKDEARNQLICNEILEVVSRGRSPLVLTERKEHLEILLAKLSTHIPHLLVLRGGMSAKEMAQVSHKLKTLPDHENRVLLATGGFVGEGFDDARLDTLFLTLPISWRGTIAQYVGRLHRLQPHKKEVQVYDYADLGTPLFEKMFNRRCQGYEAVGYKILIPSNATPGWPAEVTLPIDPAWKADYANSIQRLIRDGIDPQLATCFADTLAVQTAPLIPINEQGENRARSMSERFLYRRLETLPQTAGRFQLNAIIAELNHMEVDLLSASAKLVIELDGSQHLADKEAYRKDRRKDARLQEQGYTVLRFLSEDVGKHLDDVLDTILRMLIKKENGLEFNQKQTNLTLDYDQKPIDNTQKNGHVQENHRLTP